MRRMEYSVTVAYTKRLARKTSDHNNLRLNKKYKEMNSKAMGITSNWP